MFDLTVHSAGLHHSSGDRRSITLTRGPMSPQGRWREGPTGGRSHPVSLSQMESPAQTVLKSVDVTNKMASTFLFMATRCILTLDRHWAGSGPEPCQTLAQTESCSHIFLISQVKGNTKIFSKPQHCRALSPYLRAGCKDIIYQGPNEKSQTS